MLAVGRLLYNVPSANSGGYLVPSSFRKTVGRVPCCWRHWLEDDNRFTHWANYNVGRAGVDVWHWLDPDNEAEAVIIARLKSGDRLYWSPGIGGNPTGTRIAVGASRGRQPAEMMTPYPIRYYPMDHLAYVDDPGFSPQEAICLVGG